MTTQHTPGPWIHDADATGAVVYQETSGTIANIPMDLRAFRANARLISAAPDLLAALQELVAEWDARHADEDHRTGYTLDTWGIQLARAAIATVTGEARA